MTKLGVAVALTVSLSACDWFTDFKRQPKIDPWEAYSHDSISLFRGNPQGSVPLGGTAAPGFAISYSPTPATIDSMRALANPTPISTRSLANGKKYWQINCAVCHGMTGAGDGPFKTYSAFPPRNLLADDMKALSDGFLFGVIRNGFGMMPPYNRIEEMDRWDVVNYLRSLQGKAGSFADTLLVARPGETGDKLPGATRLGPTRPAPYIGSVLNQRAAPRPADSTRADTTAARRDAPRRDTTTAAPARGRP